MEKEFLAGVIKRFRDYKLMGEKTFAQVTDEQLFFQPNSESNSIAMIVQHMHGNMMSRWTEFLTTDGEKEWRKRDQEFEQVIKDRPVMMSRWEEGWSCLLDTLDGLSEADLKKTVTIRKEPLTALDAILRQLAHYSYHIGQIVYLGKICADKNWKSLSIPRNKSKEFNDQKNNESKPV
jgi:hypothetical protein